MDTNDADLLLMDVKKKPIEKEVCIDLLPPR